MDIAEAGTEWSREARPLTFEQGLALSLVTCRGLNYREVAERMGRAPSEVLRLLGDALHRLSDRLPDARSESVEAARQVPAAELALDLVRRVGRARSG